MGTGKMNIFGGLAILMAVLLSLPGVLLAADKQEEEGDPLSETAIGQPAGQQVNLDMLFDMQGLRVLHDELKGKNFAGAQANAPKRLFPMGTITGFQSVGHYKDLNTKNPGWYWCGCRVNLGNTSVPVGAHAAIAYWNGTGFSWSTQFGPYGVDRQTDLATNESFEFYKFVVKEGVDASFSAFYPTLYALQEAWRTGLKNGVFKYYETPWNSAEIDANCNVYAKYLMLGLGLNGGVPPWHHGADCARRAMYKDASGKEWEIIGIMNTHPIASETRIIYMEPKQ